MPIAEVEINGRIAEFEVPKGTTEQQIMDYVKKNPSMFENQKSASAPIPQSSTGFQPLPLEDTANPYEGKTTEKPSINPVGQAVRNVGLPLRSALTGVGNTFDFLSTPIHAARHLVGERDLRGGGKAAADLLNLPTPQTQSERITDNATQMMAGGMGILGLANKAQNAFQAGSTAQRVLSQMASRPDLQYSSMVGSGLAGGYAKEKGASPTVQFVASLAGGLAAPGVYSKGQQLANTAKLKFSKEQINAVSQSIDDVLRDRGIEFKNLPAQVKVAFRNDMENMLKAGDNVDPKVARRLLDYRLTGATPTAGPVTQDPALITRQNDLSSLGVRSTNDDLQRLAQIKNQNARQLTENLNVIGANASDDAMNVGQKVINHGDDILERVRKNLINPLYKKAKNSDGTSTQLKPDVAAKQIDIKLKSEGVGYALPAEIRKEVNQIAAGEIPFDVRVQQQMLTKLYGLQKDLPKFGKDGHMKRAINIVRQAIDDAPPLEGQSKAAINAYREARTANRKWMSVIDKTPALKAIRDGVEPDNFMNQFVLGKGKTASYESLKNLKNVLQKFDDSGEGVEAIRNYIAQHLKQKSLGTNLEEAGKFSSAGYFRELDKIGKNKLKLFFNDGEIDMLYAIRRVAQYEASQPAGSAVNNSNTAGALLGTLLDKLGSMPLVGRIPIVSENLRGAANSISAKQMQKIPTNGNTLTAPKTAWPLAAGVAASSDSRDNNHRQNTP